MNEPPSFWQAAEEELETYQFAGDLDLQPRWDVPEEIGIHVAVSGRLAVQVETDAPTNLDEFLKVNSGLIEAGATGIHLDYTWVSDDQGRRLDRDLTPVEAYTAVLAPLRERFGTGFIADCNILNGRTFDEALSPATHGLCDSAPCATGHPDAYLIPAMETLEANGVKPQLVVHSSGEIELAKRKLIDPGIVTPPYYWIVLYGLPFNSGRTLLSGTWLRNLQDTAQHLFIMTEQIKSISEDSVVIVCAAGRATTYITTLATMMGLHIRVGTEDTIWQAPNRDDLLSDNLEIFTKARDMAAMLGRTPASAEQWRSMLGIAPPAAVGG
jgi:3-keto-5-aminohexanoate cleavage enzyme